MDARCSQPGTPSPHPSFAGVTLRVRFCKLAFGRGAIETEAFGSESWYYIFKSLPILAGTMAIYLGDQLFIKGVSGAASLIVTHRN